ncbi:hypothetical protein, partial [Mycobacterium tuberculosis]|uniref:hypothetical protein n=1 Tax=Mycobacterium tuberculosis TaxID=1773 RepID=UPI00190F608C
TKAHIAAAVAEGVSDEAATRVADMKKPDMAQAAEQLLAGTGWLPVILRTLPPTPEPVEADTFETADADQPFAPDAIDTAVEDEADESYA